MLAYDNAGQNSGWQQMGSWTGNPAPYSQPPTAVSVTPNAGTGMSQTFSFVASDQNGAGYMTVANIYLGTSLSSPGCDVILYHDSGTQSANGAYLIADNGAWIGPVYPGGGGGAASESNSHCTINGSGITSSDSGNSWTYNLPVTFAAASAGLVNSYLLTYDHAGQFSAWQQLETWTVGAAEPVTIATNPAGLSFTADGVTYASTQTFSWAVGSQHNVTPVSPQTTGTQYGFSNWSDGSLANPRTVTVASSAASYTANSITRFPR